MMVSSSGSDHAGRVDGVVDAGMGLLGGQRTSVGGTPIEQAAVESGLPLPRSVVVPNLLGTSAAYACLENWIRCSRCNIRWKSSIRDGVVVLAFDSSDAEACASFLLVLVLCYAFISDAVLVDEIPVL